MSLSLQMEEKEKHLNREDLNSFNKLSDIKCPNLGIKV